MKISAGEQDVKISACSQLLSERPNSYTGIIIIIMVLHGIALQRMIFHGILWHCIVLYGIGLISDWSIGYGARAASRKTPIYFMIYQG